VAKAPHPPRYDAEPLVATELLALRKQQLHPEADPDQRFSGFRNTAQYIHEIVLAEGPHGIAKRADPGKHDRVRSLDAAGVTRHEDLDTYLRKGIPYALNVAERTVDDGNRNFRRFHRLPFRIASELSLLAGHRNDAG